MMTELAVSASALPWSARVGLDTISDVFGVPFDFDDDQWPLCGSGRNVNKLDFSHLGPDTEVCRHFRKKYGVHAAVVAKLLLLHLASQSQTQRPTSLRLKLRARMIGVSLLINFVHIECRNHFIQDGPAIQLTNLTNFQSFALVHTLHRESVSRAASTISRITYSNRYSISSWASALDAAGLSGIIDPQISARHETQSLKRAYTSEGESRVSYGDWSDGKSFNRLTLDFGRHYVEHCVDTIAAFGPVITAISDVMERYKSIAKSVGASDSLVNYKHFRSICVQLLFRIDVKPSILRTLRKTPSREALSDALATAYDDVVSVLHGNAEMVTEESLSKICRQLGLDDKRETIDALYVFVDAWCNDDFSRFETSFRIRFPGISFASLAEVIEQTRAALPTPARTGPPNRDEWLEWGLEYKELESGHQRPLVIATRFMNGAVAVIAAAFTGWRASELGFSMDDILVSENRDILDQQAFPVRLQVNSFIPKTHGNRIKIQREISYSTYRILRSLQQLKRIGGSTPFFANRKGNYFPRFLSSDLGQMWASFVRGYSPFRELDLVEECGIHEHELLSDRFDPSLIAAWHRAKAEFNRVDFFLNYRHRAADVRCGKAHVLWNYAKGGGIEEDTALFRRYLTDKTQDRIKSLQESNEITLDLTRSVSRELVRGCLYPSPHAFRHMWAEAVYRRFDGDVGWMIRSNFKHISRSMWHAYVRNKDHASLDGDVKSRVISSLVYRALSTKDDQFTGQFAKKVRRIFKQTVAAPPDQLHGVAEKFSASQVSDFTATPWGYCMFMSRNQHLAKCAEHGQPQRMRASPRLCMSCGNFLIQNSNVDYVVLHLAKDLEILKRGSVPAVYRKSSYKTVRAARKYLLSLAPDHGIHNEIRVSIDAYLRDTKEEAIR